MEVTWSRLLRTTFSGDDEATSQSDTLDQPIEIENNSRDNEVTEEIDSDDGVELVVDIDDDASDEPII